MSTRLTKHGIHYSKKLEGSTCEITIEGAVVWRLTLPKHKSHRFFRWPGRLNQFLFGFGQCQIIEMSSGTIQWSGVVRWTRQAERTRIVNAENQPLSLSKWGRLRVTIEDNPALQGHLLSMTSDLIAFLQGEGLPAFIMGGTLLGAVRSGKLIEYDDDADIAYLSNHSHPTDLVVENERIRQRLVSVGYHVIRHSYAHLQVIDQNVPGGFYVDIFTAFYQGNIFNQPMFLRTSDMESEILPLSQVSLNGVTFPAPQVPEDLLLASFGPSWPTPDPGFVFQTPSDTWRRFGRWFGKFDLGRHFWNDLYSSSEVRLNSDIIRQHVIKAHRNVIDLGSGSGDDGVYYRNAGLQCVMSDYASAAPSMSLGAVEVNLVNEIDNVLFLSSQMKNFGGDATVSANHLLACQNSRGREALYRLFGVALRAGARVLVSDFEQLGLYEFEDPSTWHLEFETLQQETAPFGLSCSVLERGAFSDSESIIFACSWHEG